MMRNDDTELSVRDKARMLAARLTAQIANTIIKPPRRPLEEHMIVIVTKWKAKDESVIEGAVEKGRERAADGGSDSAMSKMFFGMLRFLGFGYMEATGEGGVVVTRDEAEEDIWVITTNIGVRVEDSAKLAAALLSLHERAAKIPNGVLASLVGVKPGQARLVDLRADMA